MYFLRTFAGLYKRCCQRSLLNSIDTQQYLNLKQNNVQIGFVNFNTEEKKRVAKMMQLLQESEAIEELGIGRVRDHFSNTLFPGTSTLQHHAKNFVLLPSLYYHAAFKSRRFKDTSEVSRYIKEAEVQITRQLAEDENGKLKTDVTGITGIITYKDALKDYTKYVKYDPAYIYGSGLARYGIILGDFYEKDNKDSRFMPLNEPNDIQLRLYLTKENWLMMCLLLLFKRRR